MVGFEQAGHDLRIVTGWHERAVTGQQVAPGPAFVDGEVVDDRLHGKWQRALQLALGLRHDFRERDLGRRFVPGRKDESHATAGHAAQHPKTPEIVAELLPDPVDNGFGI